MIQVYNPGNNNFSVNGDMTLTASSVNVRAALGQVWTMTLTHPLDDAGRWKYITEGATIKAPSFNGEQLFTIVKTDKTDSGITAEAEPVGMLAKDEVFIIDKRPTNKTGQQALDILTEGTRFTATTDITKTATAYYQYVNLIEALSGGANCFTTRWGGELLFDNFTFIINERAGGDYGVVVKYGLNIPTNGFSENIDARSVVTRIYPKAYNGYTITNNGYVDSPYIDNYPNVHVATMKFENVKMIEDVSENEPAETIICNDQAELDAALIAQCNEQYATGIDRPKVTIKADMVQLNGIVGYEDYTNLVSVGLGDTVHCKHALLDITTDARVIELNYDCLAEKVTSVTLGAYQYDFFRSVGSILQRVDTAIRPDGSVMAEQVQGFIDGAMAQLRLQNTIAKKQDVRAILFEDLDPESPTYGAMALGTQGFQISRERTADGREWNWTTSATAGGIIANTIVTGLLTDRIGNNYWNLDTGDFRLSGATIIDTDVDGYATSDELTTATNTLQGEIEELQSQIDGQIMTWFYSVPPTLSNPPVALDPLDPDNTGWDTDDKKRSHIGDLYYDTTSGYAYRFVYENGSFRWLQIADSDVAEALELAQEAMDTAVARVRVFLTTPVPPYIKGDLYIPASGTIYVCVTPKDAGQSYAAADFQQRDGYASLTALAEVRTTANNAASAASSAVTTANNAKQTADSAKASADATAVIVDASARTVTVQYYVSTSPTELDGGEWSDEPPTWTDGAYIWIRNKTITNGGEIAYGTAACMTGADGADGADGAPGTPGAQGVGVSSITPIYYCSNVANVPAKPTARVTINSPTRYNVWNLQLPTWTTTYKYYFTSVEVVLDDGSRVWANAAADNGTANANATAYAANTTADSALVSANAAQSAAASAVATAATASTDAANANKKLNAMYGTCSTAAGTVAKAVTSTNFELYTGATINVYFTYTNTATNPTLNVNGTGAKPIYVDGTNITTTYYWSAKSLVQFTYNGSQWVMQADSYQMTFNHITQGGLQKVLYQANNQLLINADYIKAGEINAALIKAGILSDGVGRNYWNMVTGEFSLTAGAIGGNVTIDGYVTDDELDSGIDAAKDYADGVGSSAISTAESYADGVGTSTLNSSKSYADTVGTNTLNSSKTYANTVGTNTLNSSKTYADGVGTSTLNSSKTYADGVGTNTLNSSKTYADGVGTSTLNNAKSYTNEQIENIEVGGRNLLANTGDAVTLNIAASTANVYSAIYKKTAYGLKWNQEATANDLYTVSFDWEQTGASTAGSFYIQLNGSQCSRVSGDPITTAWSSTVKKGHVVTVCKLTAAQITNATASNGLRIRGSETSGAGAASIVWYNVKIEEGNKATMWEPAPEDFAAEIEAAHEDALLALVRQLAMYGTCTTGAGTAAKVVTLDETARAFELYKGATINVYFSNTNTAANPTLNVNGTGAKAIYVDGATITSTFYWTAKSTQTFVYDGTRWVMKADNYQMTFNHLTQGGTQQAIKQDSSGNIYINASMIKAGIIEGITLRGNTITGNTITGGTIEGAIVSGGEVISIDPSTGTGLMFSGGVLKNSGGSMDVALDVQRLHFRDYFGDNVYLQAGYLEYFQDDGSGNITQDTRLDASGGKLKIYDNYNNPNNRKVITPWVYPGDVLQFKNGVYNGHATTSRIDFFVPCSKELALITGATFAVTGGVTIRGTKGFLNNKTSITSGITWSVEIATSGFRVVGTGTFTNVDNNTPISVTHPSSSGIFTFTTS